MPDASPSDAIYFEDIEIGMSRSLVREVTERDIELFAEASSDRNPVHLDDEYANGTIFGGKVVHGMLTASLISAVIGGQLPGAGTIYLGQTLKFLAPVRPGDVVEAEVVVKSVDSARRRVALDTRCRVGDVMVLTGEALVLAPKPESRSRAARSESDGRG